MAERFDVVTFDAPPGWTQQPLGDGLMFETRRPGTRTFCQIFLRTSRKSAATLPQELDRAWAELLERQPLVAEVPDPDHLDLPSGFTIAHRVGQAQTSSGTLMVWLSLLQKEDRLVPVVANIADADAEALHLCSSAIGDFLASLRLDATSAAPAGDDHASVYIFRDSGMRAPRGERLLGKLAGNVDVFVDDIPVARLIRLSYVHFQVGPGWHLLWGKSEAEWFDFEAGHTYLLRILEGQGPNGEAVWLLDFPTNIDDRVVEAGLERVEPSPESLEELRRDLDQYPRIRERAGEPPVTDEVELKRVIYFERSPDDSEPADPPPRRDGGTLTVTEQGVSYKSAETRVEIASAEMDAFGSGVYWCAIRYVRDGTQHLATFDAANLRDHNRLVLAIENLFRR